MGKLQPDLAHRDWARQLAIHWLVNPALAASKRPAKL